MEQSGACVREAEVAADRFGGLEKNYEEFILADLLTDSRGTGDDGSSLNKDKRSQWSYVERSLTIVSFELDAAIGPSLEATTLIGPQGEIFIGQCNLFIDNNSCLAHAQNQKEASAQEGSPIKEQIDPRSSRRPSKECIAEILNNSPKKLLSSREEGVRKCGKEGRRTLNR
ncbi:hypothetical protein Ancab_008376 [Ancistrocladus abbreviatus]